MTTNIQQRRVAALVRAQQLRWWEHVIGSPTLGWMVDSTSRPRVEHSVTPSYQCSCEAGRTGAPCVHAAAAWIAAHHLEAVRWHAPTDAHHSAQEPILSASPHDGVYQRPSHRTPDLGGEDDTFSLADMLAANRAA